MTAELNRLWHGYSVQNLKGTQLLCSPRAQSISMTASAASLPVNQQVCWNGIGLLRNGCRMAVARAGNLHHASAYLHPQLSTCHAKAATSPASHLAQQHPLRTSSRPSGSTVVSLRGGRTPPNRRARSSRCAGLLSRCVHHDSPCIDRRCLWYYDERPLSASLTCLFSSKNQCQAYHVYTALATTRLCKHHLNCWHYDAVTGAHPAA